jgi:Putative beta-lactamase-inhibitor-like, PepSY-like
MRATLLSIVLLTGLATHAQTPTAVVPQAARTHFAQTYPKAVEQEWKTGTKQVKAEFKLKGEKYQALYLLDGKWVRTEHNIPKSELPAAVSAALKASKYGSWKVDDVEEHATPEQPKLYKLKVKSETAKAELFFTPEGRLVREEGKKAK